MNAKIYLRRNKSYGSSCDGCADTGHTINEYNGLFTVWTLDGDSYLITGATREEAERAIAEDWRKAEGK